MGMKATEDNRDSLICAARWMQFGERLAWEARAMMLLVSGLSPATTAEILGVDVMDLVDVRQCIEQRDPPPALLTIREEMVALVKVPKQKLSDSSKSCRQISESVVAKQPRR